jgi:archaellum component FlaC
MDIEELHRVVVQGFASMGDRIDSVDSRVADLRAHMDTEFGRVQEQFGQVQEQFRHVHEEFGRVHQEFGRVKDALMEHGRQLKDIRGALDRKVDRDELEAQH